jgi:hypothetical protein
VAPISVKSQWGKAVNNETGSGDQAFCDRVKLEIEYTWKVYEHNRDTARAHQVTRSGLMNIILVLAFGLISLSITLDDADTRVTMGVLLVVLGVYALMFMIKYYERE